MKKQLISYAQNFEDVRLWRALHAVQQGYYIDIGAQSPIVDSISRVFYENGWRGAHVDAMQVYTDELRDARSGDIVINAAVAAEPGTLTFYGIAETGLSTTQLDIAERHREAGFVVHETIVKAITLDDVFDQVGERPVHWLKIDVEGGEQDVLMGWRQSPIRPWIVVIESTLPLTDQEVFEPWEHLIVGKGYKFAHFDGLNRYYVSDLHEDLAQSFLVPPNIFDDFALSMTSNTPLKREFVRKLDESRAALIAGDAVKAELEATKTELSKSLEALSSSREDLVAQLRHSLWLKSELNENLSLAEEHKRQLETLKANVKMLQQELGATRIKLQEHAEIAHRWWVAAEGMTAELAQIHGSHSWKLTAVLRRARRILGPRRLVSAIYAGPKSVLRTIAVRFTLRLASNQRIRLLGRGILGVSPRLRERLRQSVVHEITLVVTAADKAAGHVTILVPRRKPSGELLGVRATRVLDDLQNAMDKMQGPTR